MLDSTTASLTTTHLQQHLSSVIRDYGTGALTFQIGIRDAMSILPLHVRAIVPSFESFSCSPSPSLRFTLAAAAHVEEFEAHVSATNFPS